ncbi:MAG TPA: heavy metal-binding domain-containing protein [Polyangiaceae bacterium]|nr:heavy metal-binding domain-containing protein [Polyangiaceae bacterium]
MSHSHHSRGHSDVNESAESHSCCSPPPLAAPAKVIDPVCGMTVNPATAKGGSFEYQGTTYYFCNPRCRERFSANPESFLKKDEPAALQKAPPVAAPAGTIYICPMDPEVRATAPGPCPKCGMALEPLTVSVSDEPNPELVDMTRRFR